MAESKRRRARRANGEGSVYQRGDRGTWVAQVPVGINPDGSYRFKWYSCATQAMAKALGPSQSYVYELLASETVPSITIGYTRRIPRRALEEFVATRAAEQAGYLPLLAVHPCGAETASKARFVHPIPSGTADAPVARCARMAASPRRAIRDLPLRQQRRCSSGGTTAYGTLLPTSLS